MTRGVASLGRRVYPSCMNGHRRACTGIALALLAACSSAEPKTRTAAEPTASPTDAPAAGVCTADGIVGRYTRQVDGAHRACRSHDECVTVVTGCSNTECSGAHRDFAASYPDDIDCSGYPGGVANYDCRPRFGLEAPRCREGCCVSERRQPIEGTVVGCPDGERLEIAAGTTSTTSSGLAVTFVGSSIDHYDDGGWALLLEVTFARGGEQAPRIFSANAVPREESILGHCVVLVEPGEQKVVVRAGPSPARSSH